MQLQGVLFCAFFVYGQPVTAQIADLLETATLYDVQLGSNRYGLARSYHSGGYERDNGEFQSFEEWYTPHFPELNFKFSSPLTDKMNLIWGISTGSSGEKFRLQPGLWVGFQYASEIRSDVFFILSAETLLGGRLTEKKCEALYKGLWTYNVNCRLAASKLRPEDTLQYLFHGDGWIERRAQVAIVWRF